MDKKYKIVIVLGNGFDLDLGLKTNYSDFIKSTFFQEKINKEHAYTLSRDFRQKEELNLFNYLSEKQRILKWIDLESELAVLASAYTTHSIETYKGTREIKDSNIATLLEENTFEQLRKSLCDYLKGLDYSDLNRESAAYRLMNLMNMNQLIDVLSFNYTDLNAMLNENEINVDHIHGSIADDSIILGFQDSLEIHSSYCFMIKSFSPYYQSHSVRRKLLEADEIIIFGHSLGTTDYHYFQELFNRQSNAKSVRKDIIIRIFTYNEHSRRDILMRLRAMNEKKTNLFYDLCDFAIYRTAEKQDQKRITTYFNGLKYRLNKFREEQLRGIPDNIII